MRFSATHGLVVAALLLGACSAIADPADPAAAPAPGTTAQGPGSPDGTTPAPAGAETPGIETIDHFIFLVQENRSFDHYFGTYPGANGIPRRADGSFKVCVPDKFQGGKCVRPYVSRSFDQNGGPHEHDDSVRDVNGGKMDGFIRSLKPRKGFCWTEPDLPYCDTFLGPQGQPDVMSTLGRRTIPNYWRYADRFTLHDRMFAPVDSWTLPAHLFLVSGWSAYCPDTTDPMSCRTDINLSEKTRRWDYGEEPIYAWTDVTWLMDEQGVEWAYYVGNDSCWDDPPCGPNTRKGYETSYSRNPLPGFTSFWNGERADDIRDNVLPVDRFRSQAKNGTLPSVSWIAPTSNVSDHPAGGSTTRTAMAYVTRLINTAMQGPDWGSTAIFLVWDDWGGFYDHLEPPRVDNMGYGLRVPSLVISPYAKRGFVDSRLYTFDSYLKLIEDRFLGGERLDPATLSRPDGRKHVRENIAKDLLNSFDFTQEPLPPLLLDPWPWKDREPFPSF